MVIKQLVHPQPDGRGGAQQAPRLLHLPLQDFQDRQVAFKATLVTWCSPPTFPMSCGLPRCVISMFQRMYLTHIYHMNFENAQCFVKCF